MGIVFHQFICLTDNFGLLVRDEETGAVASIDAPAGAAIAAELSRLGWGLPGVFLPHHPLDHVQGPAKLKASYLGIRVVGAKKDAPRLPHLDLEAADGDVVWLGQSPARVIDAPGHTSGHVLYHFEQD